MVDTSFTLFEPHLHGDIQLGPKEITIGRGGREDGPDEPAAEGTESTVPKAVLVAIGFVALALLARKLRER